MRKNFKTGSLLIEHLLSLVYLTAVLLPFSHLYTKLFRTNLQLEQKENEIIIADNILEYLENKDYQIIEKNIGEKTFNSYDNFCVYFHVNCKEKQKNKKFNIKVDIKRTDSYYLNKKFERFHIFKIIANDKTLYYIPHLKDYEK